MGCQFREGREVSGVVYMRYLRCPFPWLILLGLLLAIQARAQDPATLRVGTEVGFPPYVDVDAQGRSTGFAVELFKSVAQASGLKAEYMPQPWSSAWTGLQRGEVDALPLVARLPMREGLVEFTRPHTIGYDAFFTRKGRAAINTIEDARRLSVIVLRADAAHDVLVKQGFDRQLVPVDSLAQGFRLLASGQFDALLTPVVQGGMQIQLLGLGAAIEHGPVLREYRREFCFAVAKGNTQLRDRLERGLARVTASGEYDRLYRKWLGIYEPKTIPRIYVFWAVAGLLAIVALLLLWSWTLRRQVKASTRELLQHQERLENRVAERTAALSASETRFRLLVEQSPDGIFVADSTGHYTDVNSIGAAMLGYTRDELLTLSLPDILVDEEHARVPAAIASFADGSVTTAEWTFRRKDGSTFLGEVVGRQLPDGRLQAILRDITERKRAEAAQLRMVSILQATLESTADGLLVVDLEGRITGYNQRFARLWRIPEAILSARDDNQVLAFVLDQVKDPEAFLAKVRQLYSAPEQVSQDELEFKDGRIFERYSQPQWLEGRPAGRVWSFRDVTANRRATQALREADQRKDEFLAMLAHELRNPLAPSAMPPTCLVYSTSMNHASAGPRPSSKVRSRISPGWSTSCWMSLASRAARSHCTRRRSCLPICCDRPARRCSPPCRRRVISSRFNCLRSTWCWRVTSCVWSRCCKTCSITLRSSHPRVVTSSWLPAWWDRKSKSKYATTARASRRTSCPEFSTCFARARVRWTARKAVSALASPWCSAWLKCMTGGSRRTATERAWARALSSGCRCPSWCQRTYPPLATQRQ